MKISFEIEPKVKEAAFEEVKEQFDELWEDIASGWSGVWDFARADFGKFLGDLGGDAKKTLGKALGDSVVDGCKNGFDNLEPIWDKAWAGLLGSVEKQFSSLLGNLGGKLIDNLGDSLLGSGSGKFDSFIKEYSKEGATLGLALDQSGFLAPVASGLKGLGSWLGLGGGEIAGEWAPEAWAAIEGSGGGILGGMSGAEYSASMAAEMGYEGAGGLSGLGLSPALLGVGGALGVGELMAALTGGVGPLGAAVSLFSGGEGHTRESALASINADMEFLRNATEAVRQAFVAAAGNAEGFAAAIMDDMSQASLEVERLAERAGLSGEQIDAMVGSMDPMSAKLVEASQALGSANESIDAMSDVLNHSADCFFGATSATDAFDQMVRNLADSLRLPAEQAAGLGAATQGLIAQFQAGDLSAATLGERLKQAFAQALQATARDATTTVEQMRALEESIRSIPTEWTSHVNVVYNTTGQQPTYHFGGRVMHSGGWLGDMPRFHAGAQVTGLAMDEVPIIARRGEYVVRAESVTAATLPLLSALNQTGQTARAALPQPLNLHVEVHGNILGGEEGMEDLARVVERKLRQIGAGRHGA